ncbi:MAG: hypothetical protein U0229_03960 [Anaeromyxobacter sp.]
MQGPSRAPSPAAAVHTTAIALGLAALAFAPYARTASFGFLLWDDQAYVAGNARVLAGLSLEGARWALTTFHFANWHPLTWLSYLLDASLLGAAPGAMHLENAALHAANAALVFLALLRLTGARWRSALVAALFAVHPTRVEVVAWISERKELLSTLFGLVAILCHAAYARRPSAWRYALVLAAAAASLASKAMLVTLPFLLLVLDAWPLDRLRAGGWRRALLEKVPLLALSAGCATLTVVAQARGGGIPEVPLPLGERLANAIVAPVRYAGLLAWPTGLSAFYPLREGALPPGRSRAPRCSSPPRSWPRSRCAAVRRGSRRGCAGSSAPSSRSWGSCRLARRRSPIATRTSPRSGSSSWRPGARQRSRGARPGARWCPRR